MSRKHQVYFHTIVKIIDNIPYIVVYSNVNYIVGWKKRIEKEINKLPEKEQKKFVQLVYDLQEKGPIQKKWPNFSKLKDNE